MNSFELKLTTLSKDEHVVLDGIKFHGCCYVQMLIDGKDIREAEGFEDMLVVFSELQKSAACSGKYLIFTCACGVADDGGWELVDVENSSSFTKWSLFRSQQLELSFLKEEYLHAISSLSESIKATSTLLVPKNILYPEEA